MAIAAPQPKMRVTRPRALSQMTSGRFSTPLTIAMTVGRMNRIPAPRKHHIQNVRLVEVIMPPHLLAGARIRLADCYWLYVTSH
jgi:hypothetical protein